MKKFLLLSIFAFGIFTFSFSQSYGWQDISSNIPVFPYDTVASLTGVFFVNDNEGWITTNHTYNDTAAVLHTIDGGETFEVQTTLFSCNAIHMLNENEGYAGGKSGFVYRTVDGGENWNFHGTILETLADISFAPSDSIGYCCGLNGTIGKITKNGVTQMNSGVPDGLYSISFPIISKEGWVCGGSIIRHYINESWTAADQDYPSGGYNAIYMVDSLNGWVVGDGGIIAHTIDGQNWFEQTNPNPNQNTFSDLFFLDLNNGWAIGSGGTIVHTNNGGENWDVVGAGITSNSFTGVHFTSLTNGYVVGVGKTLLKYGEITGIGEKAEVLQFDIFPNPAKDKCKVKSQKLKAENATLELFDLHGRKLLEKQFRAGTEEIEIDVSQVPSGVYNCRLTSENKSTTQKLIIQK